MDAIGQDLYRLVRNKDYKWADEQVTNLRLYWQPIYPMHQSSINRSYLMCQQDMSYIKNKFKKATSFYKETNFATLPIMHKIMNRLGELLMQAPPKCEVRATDPTALSGKAQEINLLRTRKIYETLLNKANKTIGEPPQKLDISKSQSNLQDFDKLQLDDTDEEDLTTFEEFIQRMGFEIAAQEVINNSMKVNRFDEFNLREGLFDIGASNALCYDCYVDEITGAQVIRRINPEDARGVWGEAYDGRDDTAKGWERAMPLRDFLGMVGNNFNMERDWADLIWAINGCNNERFTGFKFLDGNRDTWGVPGYQEQLETFGCKEQRLIPINQAYHYNVFGGKAEWYAPDAVGNGYLMDRVTGNMTVSPVTFVDYQSDEKLFKQYTYESEVRWVAYNAIFLGYTLTTQKIYKYGEVYLQQPVGAYDEYSIGTLKYYKIPGITIGEVCKNYIDIANEAFFKIKWILDRAKPRAKQLIFNEIIAMARAMGTEKNGLVGKDGKVSNDTNDQLEKVFNYLEEHIEYDIRFYPQVRGQDVPQLPSLRQADEGIDPLTTALQLIERWAEEQVMDKIGLYDLMNANPREGLGQQKMLSEFAKNQVGYLYRIFQYCKKDVATTLLCYTHDVIKYQQSLACKWLKVMLGDETFEQLKNLGKYSPHRMGIFINDYFTQQRKKDIDDMAKIALEKGMQGAPGGITFDQWVAITGAEDYKREAKILSLFLRRQEKKARKQAIQDQQIKEQQAQAADARAKDILQTKINGELAKEKIIAENAKYVADINYKAKMDVTKTKQDFEGDKQGMRRSSQEELATHKADLEQQRAVGS